MLKALSSSVRVLLNFRHHFIAIGFAAIAIAAATGPALADALGTQWSEEESGWSGVWTRRGTSNIFDAVWTKNGATVVGVLTMSVAGDTVSIQRTDSSDGNTCDYVATLSGSAVSGTYQCAYPGSPTWTATIYGASNAGENPSGNGGETNDSSNGQPTTHQLAASIDCVPLSIRIGELPSKQCTVWITGWNHDTASPVQLILPAALDFYGNHPNGIQVFAGSMPGEPSGGVSPSNMGGFQGPDGSYGNSYPWQILVFACQAQPGTGANCLPGGTTANGPFSVPMRVHQDGSNDAFLSLDGTAFGAPNPGAGGNPGAAAAGNLVRIQSRWKPTEYLQIQDGYLESGPIQADWWSAMWEVEAVPDTSYVIFRNHWKRDQTLNIEHGALESSAVQVGAWSAEWLEVPVPGTSFFYLQNRYKPGQAINTQNGRIESGPAQSDWWSAIWAVQ